MIPIFGTLKQVNCVIVIVGMLTAFRYFPNAWEIDPLSTVICSCAVFYFCISMLQNTFKGD